MNEELILEKLNVAFRVSEQTIEPIDERWYIDYMTDTMWLTLPEKFRMPSSIGIVEKFVCMKIQEKKDEILNEIYPSEKEPKGESYILSVEITDPGTVVNHQGAGPKYNDIVQALEEAAGSFMFYLRWDSLSGVKGEIFKVDIEMYDETIDEPEDQNFFGRHEKFQSSQQVFDILYEAREFIRMYRKEQKGI